MSDAQYMMDNYTQDQCMGLWDNVDEKLSDEFIAWLDFTEDMPWSVLQLKRPVDRTANCKVEECQHYYEGCF